METLVLVSSGTTVAGGKADGLTGKERADKEKELGKLFIVCEGPNPTLPAQHDTGDKEALNPPGISDTSVGNTSVPQAV